MRTTTKERDPLICIASSKAIQSRLLTVQREAEKLKILLRVATELEQVDSPNKKGADDAN